MISGIYYYVLILFYFSLTVYAQNFHYNPEDWYIITKPSTITSISEDNFNIYFATKNGIFIYNKNSEEFNYDHSFFSDIDLSEITHFYIDRIRSYYWVVHRAGISYKSSISSIWREMSLVNSGLYSYYEIDDIGSSSEYFWIRSGNDLYPFDPFSALPVNYNDAINEVNFIDWAHSMYGESGQNIDMSSYILEGDWTVNFRNIKDKNGEKINATVYMEDSEGNHWYGTDYGYILRGWQRSHRLEIITIGLPFNNVTEAYNDNDGHWWFADNHFKRTGQISLLHEYNQSNNTSFISRWNEPDNNWIYYSSNESVVIKQTDINSILRIGSTIYFGTMSGMLYLDLYTREWNRIDDINGLNDEAVWDMIEHDGSIIIATANGIKEVSIVNHIVIPNINDHFKALSNYNIYEIESDNQYLYLATNLGLLKLNWEDGEILILSNKNIKSFKLINGKIFGTDGSLWLINEMDKEEYIVSKVENFDYCNSFFWISYKNEVILLDHTSDQFWIYNFKDGIPGNKIYDVNCDDDWVWFLTNNGVAFYNWSKYHK